MNNEKINVLPNCLMRESVTINKIGTGLCEMPIKLVEDYSLEEGDVVGLSCGSLYTQVKIVTGCSKSIGLPSDILDHLRLSEHLKMGIKAEGNNNFRLGPVIGIMTFPHVVEKKDFKRYVPYALRMKNTGLLYVFSPKWINSDLRIIKGYYYNEKQKLWEKGEFPFPDVVMDRIYPTNLENHLKLETVIGKNRIFNKNTLINKIDFFEALHMDSFLGNHIPETRLLRNVEDFKYMVSKYPGVYLKPVDGMKGKGIIEVMKINQSLVCRYMTKQGLKTLAIKKYSEIIELLKRISLQKRTYIIQAAILRMKYNNQPFEFRVMVAKNGSGEWSLPAIFTKIADSNQFLTNISAGATVMFFKDLLNGIRNKLPHSKKRFLKLLSELSLKTASMLDKNYGPLGKVGLDIVVDNTGKPWLIEANGNPGLMPRVASNEYPKWRSERYDYPLSYCLYLSGFSHLRTPFMTLN